MKKQLCAYILFIFFNDPNILIHCNIPDGKVLIEKQIGNPIISTVHINQRGE